MSTRTYYNINKYYTKVRNLAEGFLEVALKVLVNGIGITDSGGLKVLEKLLRECVDFGENHEFLIILSKSQLTDAIARRYQESEQLSIELLTFRNYVHRLSYENFSFQRLVAQHKIDLVYNFTATTQLFLKCPQLVKVHNLLFYSKKLDACYKKKSRIFLWVRQIFLKRIVFRFMLKMSKNIEIQSGHVRDSLSDYINVESKNIFVKSDVELDDAFMREPKQYDFAKKLKFLYVVGPHFDYTHKNLLDFTNGMVELTKSSVDFEIGITLTKEQLEGSDLWNDALNSRTHFHGYINDAEKVKALFCDNTILISTSVIETLGLHVLEAISNGIVTITPNESYALEVYGKQRYSYDLFDAKSLSKTVLEIINDQDAVVKTISAQQKYVRENEMTKFDNIIDVFSDVLNV